MENLSERLLALLLLILLLPVFLIIYICFKLTMTGPFIFKQKRTGKDKNPFFIYKIRTMMVNAESQKIKLNKQNEADGPVFKIYNDPRYTKFGRFLTHSGLDELLQLINIARGEMSFIGPRPFPIDEAKKIPKKFGKRFTVLPGISSLWVIKGADHTNFNRWMKLDMEYIKSKNTWYDIKIAFQTIKMLIKISI